MPRYQLAVNGATHTVEAWDGDMPLLYALRNGLGLHAVKFGCGVGQCGTCTVLVNGEPARSCLIKVSDAAGQAITTAEGLGTPARRIRCRPPSSPSRRRSAAIAPTAW